MDEHERIRRLAATLIIETQWQDAPDEGGDLHWAVIESDMPRLVSVYDDDEGVTWVFDHAAGCGYTLATYPARLWSRLPDPPPVPESEGV